MFVCVCRHVHLVHANEQVDQYAEISVDCLVSRLEGAEASFLGLLGAKASPKMGSSTCTPTCNSAESRPPSCAEIVALTAGMCRVPRKPATTNPTA